MNDFFPTGHWLNYWTCLMGKYANMVVKNCLKHHDRLLVIIINGWWVVKVYSTANLCAICLVGGVRHQRMCLLSASMDKTMIVWQPSADSGIWMEKVSNDVQSTQNSFNIYLTYLSLTWWTLLVAILEYWHLCICISFWHWSYSKFAVC